MKRNLLMQMAWAGMGAMVLAGPTARAATIYADDFNGDASLLNGAAPDTRPGTEAWSANSPFRTNGTIDGTVEGSALLPFNPVVDQVYTLSMDVANTTPQWVGLGFARDGLILPGASNINDRLSNEPEGIAWMLYRDVVVDSTQDVQLFAGLRTAGGIADNNLAVNFAQANTLKIVLNTTGVGTSFTADFFVNGVSLLAAGPVTIARTIDDINFVGLSFDNSTADTAITFDNFSLDGVAAVPEPTSLAMLALAPLAMVRRRRA